MWQPFLLLLISFVSLQQLAGPARAASLSIDRSDTKTAIFEGTIDPGDFEKLRIFLGDHRDVVQIYLASPGGSLNEALRIGLLVRRLNLSTTVPNKVLTHRALEQLSARHGLEHPERDYLCASACFFIFVAGVHRSADVNGSPLLGIHRPFVPIQKLRGVSTNLASEIKDTARAEIETYFEIMNVPSKYVLDMYSASKKLKWIRDDEFDSDFRN